MSCHVLGIIQTPPGLWHFFFHVKMKVMPETPFGLFIFFPAGNDFSQTHLFDIFFTLKKHKDYFTQISFIFTNVYLKALSSTQLNFPVKYVIVLAL